MDEILNSGKFGMIVDNTTDALCNGLECILSNRSLIEKYKGNILKIIEWSIRWMSIIICLTLKERIK